ncbi:MAG TPA: hypothetical protein VG055_22690 [Planctomycetaceae bacterium]|jgi:hypothetical protein|nr:hypothetical protein [Planctomycetaceae bacterium]
MTWRRRDLRDLDPWHVDVVFPEPGPQVPSWLVACGFALAVVLGVILSRFL